MLPISANMINFSDLSFIFRFLPAFIIAYYLVPSRLRPIILFLGSLVFYTVGDFKSLPILLIMVAVNVLLAAKCAEQKKVFLVLSVIFDIACFLAFKLLAVYGGMMGLPVGISFFTFKMISFQADLYKGRIAKKPGILETATYFIMFPQIMSGPIMRYSDFEKNEIMSGKEDRFLVLKDRVPIYLDKIEKGLFLFTLGLGMKILLADFLSMMWNEIGTIGYESISTPLAWAGVICYSLNLYYDFWGYSLMAAGIGVMLGFPFVRNFDHPYTAKSVSDFYRKWHITLGTWFRDYVYVPLGGSREGKLVTARNLLIVWILTGIWHGVTVNFLLWSGMLLLMIYMEKFVWASKKNVLRVVGRIHVFLIVPLTWVIFALPEVQDLCSYMMRLFPFWGTEGVVNSGDFVKIVGTYYPFLGAGLLLLVPGIYNYLEKKRDSWPVRVAALGLFWICVAIASTKAGNPFMYFSF